MLSTAYQVTITILVNGANGDGFIDPTTFQQYMAQGSTPSTTNSSISKVRGNQRFQMIVQQLGLLANVWLTNVVTVGADANTAPTQISFIATSEHGDGPLYTADELNPGQFLTGASAVQRCIARAMCTNYTNDYQEYYNPTSTQAVGNCGALTSNAVRYGETVGQVVIGALANNLTAAQAAITVTKIF
jgi:hypothetical protein